MPVHDWTRVDAGIFHDFHTAWIPELRKVLNAGLLPPGFYALAEQHAGYGIADVLTLHASASSERPGVQTLQNGFVARRRTLAIRHVSGHRLIAILEIVSPANKDRPQTVNRFADKVVEALDAGVQVLVVDLLPPGPHDPQGMHGAILQRWLPPGEPYQPYDLPAEEPLTLASYATGTEVNTFVEHLAVGAPLPEMPLFLHADRYVNVPLESTYEAAYSGMPAFWRDVLEGRAPKVS